MYKRQDEARTPLIISGQGEKSTDLYEKADKFARTLKMTKIKEVDAKEDIDEKYDGDYIVDEKAKTATLTPEGVKKACLLYTSWWRQAFLEAKAFLPYL